MLRTVQFQCLVVALGSVACLGVASNAFSETDSGQRTFGQASVEPAIDYSNGSTVYLLTPDKAPVPVTVKGPSLHKAGEQGFR